MRHHETAAVFVALATFLLVSGCSSDTPADQASVECGSGTELSGGVCVLVDGGDSGSHTIDGAVDGASADVVQDVDGDQPEVHVPIDASEDLDGPGSDVEQDAEGGSGENEPCLPDYTLNCTSVWGDMSCSPSADDCEPHVCEQNGYKIDSLPFTMRMPSGLMPPLACSECSAYLTTFAVLLQIDVEPDPNMRVRIRVGEPWRIVVSPLTTLNGAYCDKIDSVPDCVVTDTDTWFYVAITTSEDPTFARNVTVEQVPIGTTCP